MELNVSDLVKAVSDRQNASERQISELCAAIKALEAKVAELSSAGLHPATVQKTTAVAAAPVAVAPVQPKSAEISPEILVVLGAAVTSFLGKEVRIRSAKMLQSPYEVVNPWAQQGRVVVMASHNLLSRR